MVTAASASAVVVVGSDKVVDVDVDSIGDWGKEVTSNSSAITLDSSADIVLCAETCCAMTAQWPI